MLDKLGSQLKQNITKAKQQTNALCFRLYSFIASQKGDGMISNLLWIAVAAVVSGAIAYAIWKSLADQTATVKNVIQNTIH